MGSGLSVFVTDKSAEVMTCVASVSELFAESVSAVVELTVAVLLIDEPLAAAGLTCTTSVNVALAPAASVLIAAPKLPLPPTAGFVNVKVGPAVCMAETNVVLAGMASARLM